MNRHRRPRPAFALRPFLGEYFLVVGLTIVPLLLFAIGASAILTQQESRAVLATLERRTTAAVVALDRLFGRELGRMTTLAGSGSLDDGNLAEFYTEAVRALHAQPEWLTVILSEPGSGQQLVNPLRPFATPLPVFPDLESHESVVRTQRPAMVARPVSAWPVAGQPIFGLRVPVVRDGKVVYVLSAAVRPEIVAGLVQRLDLPAGWGPGIVDEKGIVLACTKCPPDSLGRTVQPELRRLVESGQSGSGRTVSLSGEPSHFTAVRGPVTGWFFVIRLPVSQITAIWLRELWVVGVGGLLSLVAAMAALAWLIRQRRRQHLVLESRVAQRTAALERALAERDLFLHEVNHRVKNNLQIVGSLIGLHRLRLGDAEGRRVLDDIRSRIHSLGLVHQKLMESGNPATLDIKPFIEDLCADLASAAGAEWRGIAIDVQAASLVASFDYAVPVGLLINELLTNALKHNFGAEQGGVVQVTFAVDTSQARLSVRNDSVPGTVLPASSGGGVGLRIVRALVTQLDGEIRFATTGDGVEVTVTMPLQGSIDGRK